MTDNSELEYAANVIEGAICGFDLSQKHVTNDMFYESTMQRLLDLYHFRDETLSFTDNMEKEGTTFIEAAIRKDLPTVPDEILVKIIGTVYRSIKRHNNGGRNSREYIDFIYQHVGIRVESGVRVLPNLKQFGT